MARRTTGNPANCGWTQCDTAGKRFGWKSARSGGPPEQFALDLREHAFLPADFEINRGLGCADTAGVVGGQNFGGVERFSRQAGRTLLAQWGPGVHSR